MEPVINTSFRPTSFTYVELYVFAFSQFPAVYTITQLFSFLVRSFEQALMRVAFYVALSLAYHT